MHARFMVKVNGAADWARTSYVLLKRQVHFHQWYDGELGKVYGNRTHLNAVKARFLTQSNYTS